MAHILLVDDEEPILDFVSYSLQKHGYTVSIARSGEEAVGKARDHPYDLVILDIMLPDFDGFEVCKRLRSEGTVPVLMLSALNTETDKVLGLELGADDYLTKPFGVRELLARVKALLRRPPVPPEPVEPLALSWGDALELDPGKRRCLAGGDVVALTNKEFELLRYLMVNRGLVLTRLTIMEAVWGLDAPSGERTVDSHVKTLRRKLGAAGVEDPIETVRGVGYRLKEE